MSVVYVPQFDIKDLDWAKGTLRVSDDSGVVVLMFVEEVSKIVYVLDVKGVEV